MHGEHPMFSIGTWEPWLWSTKGEGFPNWVIEDSCLGWSRWEREARTWELEHGMIASLKGPCQQWNSWEIKSGELQESPYDYIYCNYPAHRPQQYKYKQDKNRMRVKCYWLRERDDKGCVSTISKYVGHGKECESATIQTWQSGSRYSDTGGSWENSHWLEQSSMGPEKIWMINHQSMWGTVPLGARAGLLSQ